MKTQLEIERENFMISTEKLEREFYKSSQNGSLDNVKGASQVLQHYKDALADELLIATEKAKNGKAMPRRVANQVIEVLGAEVVAHYTVKTIINLLGFKNKYSSAANQLALLLEKEFLLHKSKEDSRERFKFLQTVLKRRTYGTERKMQAASVLVHRYQKLGEIGMRQKFHSTALYCIEYISLVLPEIRGVRFDKLFSITTENTGNSQCKYIILKSWFKEYLINNIKNGNLVTAYNTPMVEKPLPWTNLRDGGYYTDNLKYTFISRGKHRDYKDADLTNTFKAVNRLQNTALKVNSKIYEIMKYSIQNNLGFGDLPVMDKYTYVPYPYEGIKYKDLDEEKQQVVRLWSKHKASIHNQEISDNSKYMKMLRVFAEAKRFKDYPEIYYAYYVDYRGRLYPKANALSPQGDKYSKALLQFAEGKAIKTLDDEKFLAMHGCNTWGEDKLSFFDKHQFILGLERDIIACAENPKADNAIWHKADDPWNFLAFCFEWAAYRKLGTEFKSYLSIAMDGSCNGLQHLSAMFLDEVGGKSVNLTDNISKGDIYDDVKEVTIDLLRQRKTEIGLKLIDIEAVTRKACKRPVMTVPYAGTKMGTRDYVRVYLEENNLLTHFSEEDRTQVITEYTDALWDAIGMKIIKGREIMEFLRKAAPRIIRSSKKTTIDWVTPNGFKVVQRKPNLKTIQANTMLGEFAGNKRVMVQMQYALDTPNTRKHGNSIAPNLIHSLDACHLQNTINSLPDGVCFNMIHDSYGTHASDSRAMYEAIRQQFYDIYKNKDVLQNWIAQQPEFDQPDLPEFGNLDLKEVLNSEYFFA
jgi:DNA-directed RNA polymerase